MAKILFLGGSYMQLAAINYAKSQNHYTICADYLKNSPGHRIADESHLISTTDGDLIYELAKNSNVDAVIAYASDPAAPIASKVSEQLGLIGNPYNSVLTLTMKNRFRDFLQRNDFNTPLYSVFDNLISLERHFSNKKIVIKPVDSSGSKGVSVVSTKDEIKIAFENAMRYSRSKQIIAEEFVPMTGYQIAGDGFVYRGKLVFRCFANEHFNSSGNSHVPIGESFPYIDECLLSSKIHAEIQRLITLLDIKVGALNFDIRVNGTDIYLMEIGPRNGGNFIPELIKISTGQDLIKFTIDAHLGKTCDDLIMMHPKGFYSSYIIHSKKHGILKEIIFDRLMANNIIRYEQWIYEGENVEVFNDASKSIGIIILKFGTQDEMLKKMDMMSNYVIVKFQN